MMYILMLRPKLFSNRLFALYMFILASGSFGILVASIASEPAIIYEASLAHALATMSATPLLWLLVLNVFIPQHRLVQLAKWPLFILAALPLIVYFAGMLTPIPVLFNDEALTVAQGYISPNDFLNGRIGHIFYLVYISTLNSLLVVPIGIFAFSRLLPDRLRHAARVLFLLASSVAVLYMPWFNISIALRNMLTPLIAAIGAAWVMRRYHFFSPVELAMKQVINSVTIGLLVFDEQLNLLDANAFAATLLPLKMPKDVQAISLPQLLERLQPQVVNQEALSALQTAVRLAPTQMHQEEIVCQNNTLPAEEAKTWLSLTIRPVYDDSHGFIGCACTVEDFTVERRTQFYIADAHRAIEQYAHNQALLNEITQAAISASDFDKSLSVLASRLTELLNADQCYISLWDKVNERPIAAVAYGEGTEAYLTIERKPSDFSLSQTVYASINALPIEDIRETSFVSQHVARFLPTRGMLALPMKTNDEAVGALMLGYSQPRQFTTEEVKWGEQIAQQLALAISKNQLLATEQEQRLLLEALQKAGQALISTLNFDQVLDRILEEIARVVPYDTVNFARIQDGKACTVRQRDFGVRDAARGAKYSEETVEIAKMPTLRRMYQTKRPLRIPDTTKSEDWVWGGHVKSWMGVPIIFNDEPIAFLMVDKIEPNFYQAKHEKDLVAFTNQATLALKHAQLFTEIQRRVTELESLSIVSAAMRSSENVPTILQSALKAMVDILSARVGVVFLLNEAGTAVVSQASYPSNYYPAGISYALGEGITGYVAQTGELYASEEINQETRRVLKVEEPEGVNQLKSTIALPLVSEDGILGVIHLGLATQYHFADDEVHTLQAMSDIVANGLQRIQLMQTLEARVASRTVDLEMANEQLQELDKLKTKFIADVSHELRTPVANLSIYINLLENGNPEKKAQYIKILQQQAIRLTNLVEATLGLSKLEIGQQQQVFGPIELNPIIREIVLGHQARADAYGVTLTCLLEPHLPPLWGNKTQLMQLITNLLTNGINYNEKQGEVVIETCVADDAFVRLSFSDDGVGIEEDELPHLFDRFYRGQRTGQSNIPGTGLGLAIVKEIVELHQGDISVRSKVNEGTTFTLRLPVYKQEEGVM
ncbi:GAF domain-containing protein [Candidatus Leptofilum sp.]|uniref:GAF domain-containing protein n=1 Tax=Candidatus Leptofilum sp. TaxID=3241576 RepID=UPI003B5B3ED1